MKMHFISLGPYSARKLNRTITVWLTVILFFSFIFASSAGHASPQDTQAPFGTGLGAWPVQGGIYEVSPDYFPNHSIKELTTRIPALEKLGISVIYMTPVFEYLHPAPYLILDYYKIDPRYGTPDDLREMVSVAHAHKIKVLLDLVTSLTPDGSYFMTKHPEWILRGKDGKMQRYYPFPEWGWALDCANPGLIEYYTNLARYYVEKFDTDGWRVDSPMNNYDPAKVEGDHSRLAMFRSVKSAITAAKKDAILVGEISGPEVMWGKDDTKAQPLFDEMFEASYNYDSSGFLGGDKDQCFYVTLHGSPNVVPYQPTLLNKVVHGEISSKEVIEALANQRILYNRLRANFLENHDTDRVSRCFPRQHRPLFIFIATIPGIPVIHAGQEIGSTVHGNFNGGNNVVDWKGGDANLQSFYEQVMKIRAGNKALLAGSLHDAWRSGDKAISFLRTAGDKHVVVTLNFGAKPIHCRIGVPTAGPGLRPPHDFVVRDEFSGEVKNYQAGQLENLEVSLPAYGYQILSISPKRP